jgi:hypothetical protein
VARHFIVGSLGGKHFTSVRKRHLYRGNHERSPHILSWHPMLASLRDDSMGRRDKDPADTHELRRREAEK